VNQRPFRPIASKLILSIYLWATACALVLSVLQAGFSYQLVHERFEAELESIAETNIPLLSINIWDIEPKIIKRQVEVIANRREIGFVRVRVATGQVFSAGNEALSKDQPPRVFSIPPPVKFGKPLGSIEIYEDPAAFWQGFKVSVGFTLLSYGVMTFIVCLIIAIILKRQLEQPLRRIALFVSELTPSQLTRPLVLDRPPNHRRDEIDLVVDGFRTLQDGIHGHIANLDQLVEKRTVELEAALASLRHFSSVDALTGCLNRGSFDERIGLEVRRTERYCRSLSLIFCDIDFFKQVNDNYGHAVGDQVLKAVADVLGAGLRTDVDILARYGGEEFVIILPESDVADAVATAERLRLAIEALVPVSELPAFRVTVSFGVAQHCFGQTAETLIKNADAFLYLAKANGRNRVCFESDNSSAT
jgi:two-component system, cell cycle response regulator